MHAWLKINEKYDVSGYTEVTVEGVTYKVGWSWTGYEQGKQTIMVQGLDYQDAPYDTVIVEEMEDELP